MDGTDEYMWQRRIHQGVKYQKSTVPFPQSVENGLVFSAALEREEKLDLCLLTNGVMLELCDFAKTVTRSEKYFLFEMLEFNFDLGVDADNEEQCYVYAARVHNKINRLKEQVAVKSHRWSETFTLPDQKTIAGFTESERAKGYYPKRNKVVDISVLTDGSKSSRPSENQTMERSGAVSSECLIRKRRGVKLKSDAYPFCEELGVCLTFRPDDPKRKLDPNLVTVGVMMELLDFSRVLCGTLTTIVHDLVKHNFGIELDKMQFRLHVAKLTEQKYTRQTAEEKEAFLKEPFRVQTKKPEQNRRKRKYPDVDCEELERRTTDCERNGALTDRDGDFKEMLQGGDLSYTCPVDFETEMQSSSEESCTSGEAAETNSAASVDVKQEEEEVVVSAVQPHTNGRESDSSIFKLHPTNTFLEAVSDTEDGKEDVKAKALRQRLWMRRATRSRKILNSSKVTDLFMHCREIGLDFNVGSGNKQRLDPQLLTNYVVWEVYRFTSAMRKSSHTFLVEIMDLNFNFVAHNELHERNFIYYMVTKEKNLQDHPARWKREFLSSPFRFPQVYNTVGVTSDSQADAEQQPESDSDSQASAQSQQAFVDSHPFCKELGLNLWSAERRPASQKLDLNALTTGAVLEIFSFVRELCGEVREMVNDVLEHNFDVDLHSGTTEASKVIQRWFLLQKTLMKNQYRTPKVCRWLNMVVPLNGYPKPEPRPPRTAKRLKVLDTEDLKPDIKVEVFDAHMEEVKKVNRYDICKEIGLDLDISSRSGAKSKLDLRVLTRGVLFEMHQYVTQNSKRYVPALYEILEYNFDLSSQKHRKVEFAWSIASQVITIAAKSGRKGDYLNRVFELPFEVSESSQIACKEEPEDDVSELDPHDNTDIVFVRELKPVDIEIEIE